MKKEKSNLDIRSRAKELGIPLWQIAYAYGCTDASFSRKLRLELEDSEKEKIFTIIERLASEK